MPASLQAVFHALSKRLIRLSPLLFTKKEGQLATILLASRKILRQILESDPIKIDAGHFVLCLSPDAIPRVEPPFIVCKRPHLVDPMGHMGQHAQGWISGRQIVLDHVVSSFHGFGWV